MGNNYEAELEQLFQNIKVVPFTSPPVYLVDDYLIGFDKLEHIQVIGRSHTLSQKQLNWLTRLENWMIRIAR